MDVRAPALLRGARRMRVAYRRQQAGEVSQKRKDVGAAVGHNYLICYEVYAELFLSATNFVRIRQFSIRGVIV